jgi:chromosome segregation ATPase
MKSGKKTGLFVTSIVVAALVFMGAAAPDQAEKVAQRMLKFDQALTQAQTQIDTTLASMNALSTASGNDLAAKYKEYSNNVKKLESMAQKAKAQSQQATAQREQYLKQWETSQAKIQNEQLKAASQTRRDELMPKIEAIKTSLTSAKDAFQPFMQDLKDLNLYLGNNLNPQGIAGASELMTKSTSAGETVKTSIQQGQATIKDLAASISPGGAAAAK